MSLIEKLEGLKFQPSTACKMGDVLSRLDTENRQYIEDVLTTPPGTQGRISDATLSAVLRSEGYTVGRSTVGEHRRMVCSCYGLGD